MNTIKIIVLLCLLSVVTLTMSSCELLNSMLGSDEPEQTTLEETTPEETTPEETTPEPHVHHEETIYGYSATCTEDGLSDGVMCTDCGETLVKQESIPAMGHVEMIRQAVEPTCTREGLTEGKYCWECWEVFEEQEVIPATGHTEEVDKAVEPTCTEAGLDEGKHCSVCGETLKEQSVIPATGHNYTSVETAPTATEDGSKEYSCSVCGYSYTETITPIDYTVSQGNRDRFWTDQQAGKLVVPAVFEDGGKWYRVVTISEMAFYRCSDLCSLSIPCTVTNIAHLNLYGTNNLFEIIIDTENPVYYSEENCIIERASKTLIRGCQSSIIPQGVTCIGVNAFSGIRKLTSVTIPEGITRIERYAFAQCYDLRSVSIASSVTWIGDNAFNECEKLSSIVIPDKVTGIQEKTFWACKSLKSVTIGNGITYINARAFEGCAALEALVIPANVQSIAKDAFHYCSESLQNIVVDANNLYYSGEGNCLVELASKTLLLGCNNSEIPQNVETITNLAFYGCSGLTGIIIPKSVKNIESWAFRDCKALVRIVYRGSVEQWNNMTKATGWDESTGKYTVYCTDGEIAK